MPSDRLEQELTIVKERINLISLHMNGWHNKKGTITQGQ